jgi:hypothetical protein
LSVAIAFQRRWPGMAALTVRPMKDYGYRVGLILREDYGEKVTELLDQMPLWVVNTPINQLVVKKLWTFHANRSHLVLGERFLDDTTIQICMRALSSIDLNSRLTGRRSHSEVVVNGVAPSDELRHTFADHGFDRFEESTEGFVAYRGKV